MPVTVICSIFLQLRRFALLSTVTVLQRRPGELMPAFRADLEAAGSEAAALRVVVDQVASLTDPSAVQWHARLC